MIEKNQDKILDGDDSNVQEINNEYEEFSIPIFIKTDSVQNLEFSEESFKCGVSDVSRLCGQISALANVGIHPHVALSYLSDKESTENINKYNYEISKLNAESNVQAAKFGVANFTKVSI